MTNIRPLSSALEKIAKEELNEDPERIQGDLNILRAWLMKQPHLRARTNDQFLVSFLRGSKYSIERAKQKLDMFYTVRSAIPELFKNRNIDDPRIREILRLAVGINLPITDGEGGPRISLIRAGAYDADKYNIKEIIKVGTIIGDIQLLEDDNMVVSGNIAILDLANVTRSHLFQFDAIFLKQLAVLSQEATPLRQRGSHYINTPPGFEFIFNIFKGLMNEKNKSRFHVHANNMESLFEHIPKKIFPPEYGGDGGTIEDIGDYWEKKLLSYRDYFLEDEQYGVDEKLRPGKPRQKEDLFGVEGTFRQLALD